MTLQIIFEDEELLVVNKPPGLTVTKSETTKEETLEDWLERRSQKILNRVEDDNPRRSGIVHRLDKDTSGLILVAKTPNGLSNLQAQFKSRVVKKEYIALVHGFIEQGGVVEGSIGRNPGNREKFTVIPPGGSLPRLRSGQASPPSRWAETEYEVVENLQFQNLNFQEIFNNLNKIQMRKLGRMGYNNFTLLSAKPKTGRTHQIRVHLKYIGHPIVSDEKYVGRKMNRLDRRWCPRMFLHAAKLGFKHPVSGKWIQLETKLPEDLEKVLLKLDNG